MEPLKTEFRWDYLLGYLEKGINVIIKRKPR